MAGNEENEPKVPDCPEEKAEACQLLGRGREQGQSRPKPPSEGIHCRAQSDQPTPPAHSAAGADADCGS